jgi:hypothetical protein|tara:strand:- start:3041 stop:4033 length:993 start_codon:yes stop_codon:yes gene_type:complete
MNREKLAAAASQGIISDDQVEALLSFFASSNAVSNRAEEPLRFVRGVGDIFITLGVLFVAVATAQISLSPLWNMLPALVCVAAAEWLIRVRRLVLPGVAVFMSLLYFSSEALQASLGSSFGNYIDSNISLSLSMLLVLSAVFYARYRLPFTLLPIALGCIALVSSLLDIDIRSVNSVAIVYGLLIFAVAMWLDSRDVERQTVSSDSAFWLHLLAAPLIVHGVMFTLLVSADAAAYKNIAILVFFSGFFLLALYVDRRALLVSSLSYAIYAVVQLSDSSLFNIENLTLLAFVGLGLVIVLFGVYWQGIRSLIFSRCSSLSLSKFVPGFNRA